MHPHVQTIGRPDERHRFLSRPAPELGTLPTMGAHTHHWDGALDRFATHLAAGGAASGTIRTRMTYLRRVADTCPVLGQVTTRDLETWMAGHQWRPETRKSARAAVVTFFAWAVRAGLLEHDPGADLATIAVPPAEPRPAPVDVVRSTFAGTAASGDPRDRLMVELALMCGLRVHEIAQVHGGDVEGDSLRVRGKGGRERLVPLTAPLLLALRSRRGWLFPGQVDGHLSAGYVQRRIDRVMPAGWTPHTLRHAAATAFYEASGFDLLATQRFLGHSSPATTQRYVAMPRARINAAAAAAAALWATVA